MFELQCAKELLHFFDDNRNRMLICQYWFLNNTQQHLDIDIKRFHFSFQNFPLHSTLCHFWKAFSTMQYHVLPGHPRRIDEAFF
jgi:hypothetical protein